MFNNVIVGVDRHGGRDPIALAKRLLADGGELTLAHVFPGIPHAWQSTRQFELPGYQEAADMLDRAAVEAGPGTHVRWREDDSTGRALHELCELIEADLLVVGSSRRGLLGRVHCSATTPGRRSTARRVPLPWHPTGYAEQPVSVREIGVHTTARPRVSTQSTSARNRLADGFGADAARRSKWCHSPPMDRRWGPSVLRVAWRT